MWRSSKLRPQVISLNFFFPFLFFVCFFLFCTVIEGIVAIFSRVKVMLLSVQIFQLVAMESSGDKWAAFTFIRESLGVFLCRFISLSLFSYMHSAK